MLFLFLLIHNSQKFIILEVANTKKKEQFKKYFMRKTYIRNPMTIDVDFLYYELLLLFIMIDEMWLALNDNYF